MGHGGRESFLVQLHGVRDRLAPWPARGGVGVRPVRRYQDAIGQPYGFGGHETARIVLADIRRLPVRKLANGIQRSIDPAEWLGDRDAVGGGLDDLVARVRAEDIERVGLRGCAVGEDHGEGVGLELEHRTHKWRDRNWAGRPDRGRSPEVDSLGSAAGVHVPRGTGGDVQNVQRVVVWRIEASDGEIARDDGGAELTSEPEADGCDVGDADEWQSAAQIPA